MKVSILGLGRMGGAMADRLLHAGHELAVWNRTTSVADPFVERGAVRLERPKEAWEHGDLAIAMLADDRAVEAVFLGGEGLLATDGPDRTAVDMSTIGIPTSERVAQRARECGAAYLRAPVTGNPAVVAAGTLGVIVSGPREAYDAVEAVLRDIGPNHFYVGSAEQARVVKLAINLMIAGTSELIAEALVMAERNDIERAKMLEVMGGSVVGSPFVKYKTDALIADDYTSTFTTEGLYKDLALALECANAVGVPLPIGSLVQQLVQGCISQGMGDIDFMSLLPRLRREAGLG
jgi:3-hydroxyisobutyrate dehydrogenase-like beta-hydroxyacid dehydrogenase